MSNATTERPRGPLLQVGSPGDVGRFALACVVAFVAGGCSSVPRVASSGQVADYVLQGLLDHRVAGDYLAGRPLPAPLEALRFQSRSSGAVPSREVLAQVAREYSPDVGTLLFLESLSARPDVRELRASYERELAVVRRVGAANAPPEPPKDLLVLMVPGWFYLSHGHETNADFRIQRRLYERWGITHRLVPTNENGAVENNARVVAAAVREASVHHRVFLVSASKGSAEVALALGRELSDVDASRVVGWLSIVGTVRGSPLADAALGSALCPLIRAKFALEGFDLAGLRSMRATTARPTFNALRFPAHVRTISLIAVPLSGQISERASFTYGRLRDLGPNDGLTLLADELIPGSVPLILPGVDHFLGRDDQRIWSTALFRTLMAGLPRNEGR